MANILVLGFFDGIHLAHREVISSAVNYKKNNDKVVLITFEDSPSLYFKNIAEYILPREYTYKLAKENGVDEVIALKFSDIANMTASEYLNFLIKRFSPKSISTGFNHTFGLGRTGNPEFLNKFANIYNYTYICVPNYTINGESVSSSTIKKYLKSGNIAKANEMLGYNFMLKGNVIEGNKLGREIGFPTANIKYPSQIINIPYGVYKTRASINSVSYASIMNWGIKPTINGSTEPIAEVHLLNFNGDLYGQCLEVEVLEKIRDEQKFLDITELKVQIERDIKCLEQ